MYIQTLGIDISLNHGACALLTWKLLAGCPVIVDLHTEAWDFTRRPFWVTLARTVPDSTVLQRKAVWITQSITQTARAHVPIGMDYDATIGSWPGRRKDAIRTAFLLGGVAALLASKQYTVHTVTPREVRKVLTLQPNASKHDVWHAFCAQALCEPYCALPTYQQHDVRDAIVLAWYVQQRACQDA